MSRIVTQHLHLLHLGPSELRILADNPVAFERAQQVRLAGGIPELLQSGPFSLSLSIAMAAKEGAEGEWRLPWILIHHTERTVLGVASFGQAPGPSGVVELSHAFSTEFGPDEYAGEAIAGLARWALRQPGVAKISLRAPRDGTLGERVLAPIGFHREEPPLEPGQEMADIWSRSSTPQPQPTTPP
jgi:hypothetical protein